MVIEQEMRRRRHSETTAFDGMESEPLSVSSRRGLSKEEASERGPLSVCCQQQAWKEPNDCDAD